MTTEPKHDLHSELLDGRAVLAQARHDARANREFAARIGDHELTHFDASLTELARAEGSRTTTLHAQTLAGVHKSRAFAGALHFLTLVHTDAKLAFPNDPATQHLFGVGREAHEHSEPEIESALLAIRDAAESHPTEARKVHLDAHALHALEDLIHGVQQSESLHDDAKRGRHDDALARDALLHAVLAETAHLRLVAYRVFIDDPAARERYARTLPRRTVKHRAKPAAAAAAATT